MLAILGDELLGPAVLYNTLKRAVYHGFLFNDLPVLLEDVPLHEQHMWFVPDATSPHFLCTVRQHVNRLK